MYRRVRYNVVRYVVVNLYIHAYKQYVELADMFGNLPVRHFAVLGNVHLRERGLQL